MTAVITHYLVHDTGHLLGVLAMAMVLVTFFRQMKIETGFLAKGGDRIPGQGAFWPRSVKWHSSSGHGHHHNMRDDTVTFRP
jgi:hypothetical protein